MFTGHAIGLTGWSFLLAAARLVGQEPPQAGAPAQPLQVSEVIHAAMSSSPPVKAAQARVSAANGSRRSAGALPNPVFTYQLENAAFPGQDLPGGIGSESSYLATLPLEPLYQRGPQVRRGDEQVRAAEADLTAARRQAGLEAARAFYEVALAQIAADGAEDVRRRLESVASLNRGRVREGATAEADLIRTQIELDRAEAEAVTQRIQFSRAWASLKPFLDSSTAVRVRGPEPPRVEVADGGANDSALPDLARLIATSRTTRPDLLAARARVAAARAETGYQRALTLRQVGATFGTKRVSGVNTMVLGVSLPVPLFNQNGGEVDRANGERLAAEQELEWAERRAIAEIEAAYEAAHLLRKQVAKFQGRFLQRAEEARRIALAAYQEGAVTLLQVLDASRTLAESRLIYYRTLFGERQSRLELSVAVGADPAEPLVPSGTEAALIPKSPSRTGDQP